MNTILAKAHSFEAESNLVLVAKKSGRHSKKFFTKKTK